MKDLTWWDLDKTYLRTDFDSAAQLLRTAFEGSSNKRTHVGADTLLRAIRDHGAAAHIISGSPKQMRGVISRKFRIDEVEFDSLTLKPNVANVLRFRFRAVRDQLGYKLPAVLSTLRGARDVRVLAVGDDSEADTFIYSLAADILAGAVELPLVREVMHRAGAYQDDIDRTLYIAAQVHGAGEMSRILIHLERRTPLSRFAPYGARVVPFYNYMQAAHICFDAHWLDAPGLLSVARVMATRHLFDGDQLARSFAELSTRGVLGNREGGAEELLATHQEAGGAPSPAMDQWLDALRQPGDETRPPRTTRGVPDYLALAPTHNWRH